MDKIKNGDLVQLKSGGPTMTVVDAQAVEDAGEESEIAVVWFHPTSLLSAAAIGGQPVAYAIDVQEMCFPACALRVVESA